MVVELMYIDLQNDKDDNVMTKFISEDGVSP